MKLDEAKALRDSLDALIAEAEKSGKQEFDLLDQLDADAEKAIEDAKSTIDRLRRDSV